MNDETALRRGIPILAAMTIAFVGCGVEEERTDSDVDWDTGDATDTTVDRDTAERSDIRGGTDEIVSTSTLRRFCLEAVVCTPDDYTTVEECVSYNDYLLNEYRYEGDVDPDCLDAWYAYLACWFTNSTCQEYAYDGEPYQRMGDGTLCDGMQPALEGCFE